MALEDDPFFCNCDRSGGPASCWNWLGEIYADGYGKPRAEDLARFYCINAHRIGYQIAKGPIPKLLQVDHLCRNRACCNPSHLEAVPQKVNLLRGEGICAKNARKTHCKQGHEFTPENTQFYNSPTWGMIRKCRKCRQIANRKSLTPEQRANKNARRKERRRLDPNSDPH